MKLNDVKPSSYIRVIDDEPRRPPADERALSDVLYFKNIDGMYSYCVTEKGDVVHLAAWTEVEPTEKPHDWPR